MSWVVMLRGHTDSQIARIWAHDENGLRRIVADLHPGYEIQTLRAEASTILPFCVEIGHATPPLPEPSGDGG